MALWCDQAKHEASFSRGVIFAGRHTQVKRAANSWIHDILSLNTNKYKSSSPPAPSRQSSEATPEAPPR